MIRTRRLATCARICCCICLALLLSACASHPLGISDAEWNQLTPEQKLEARKQDEQNKLEREKLRRAEQKQREEAQLKEDIAQGMVLRFSPERPYCMGGDRCPRDSFPEIILSLHRLTDVDKVLFYADDNLGHKHEGKVTVYADDLPVAQDIDIERHGKWYQVLVGRPARNITLRAIGDDEVEIYQVKVYGSQVNDARYILIR
ncbi:hypothetical protein [Pseudodesulfovibrio sp.]|uniref:hypothetical protein n=1 Tax=unclassified Pseudodesulfovibrio TaxID=2661612 RepID=UPI003B00C0E3